MIAVLLVLLLISAGIAYWYFVLRESSAPESEPESEPESAPAPAPAPVGPAFYCVTKDKKVLNKEKPLYMSFKKGDDRKKVSTKECIKTYPNTNFTRSKWGCYLDGTKISERTIWWGHTEGDAKWGCNEWETKCNKKCTAKPAIL